MTTLVKPWMIDAGPLVGFRNKLINGDFDFWDYATSVSTGFAANRWFVALGSSTTTYSRQPFALGQTEVPGNPKYFARNVVTSSAGASNFALFSQKVEGVQTLSGGLATLVFWAKADSAKNIAVEFQQEFGTGGAPSADNTFHVETCALTTAWKMFAVLVDVDSISGEALGTDGNDNLQVVFWFDAGSSFNSRTNSLGQQSGTFDIAHVCLVPGDARQEAKEGDPFEQRSPVIEGLLRKRYYQKLTFPTITYGMAPFYNSAVGIERYWFVDIPTMRAAPTATDNITLNSDSVGAISTSPSRISFRTTSGIAAGNVVFVSSGNIELNAEL